MIIWTFIVLSYSAIAQSHLDCGFDRYRLELLENTPGFREKEAESEQLLYERLRSGTSLHKQSSVILTIPTVVHVMHLNGPENVPDSLVIAAIDELNLRFENAPPYNDITGYDVQIRFCLATVDPQGNPTNGITRTYSNCTNIGSTPDATENNMKNLARWEPFLYMNILLINSLPAGTNVAGYATGPSSAGTSIDGIVMLRSYLNNSYVLVHEVGHYLGLYHTFNGGCVNYNCLIDGDKVCDTPPDYTFDYLCSSNSCSTELNDTTGLSPFTSDVPELPNYIDYTNCSLSFSEGQGERMYNALSLLRSQLVLSNGCGQNPGGAIPTPSFTSSIGCPGTNFTNTSINGVGASWDFNSDGMIDAAGNSVSYSFPSIGYYDVTMYSYGYGGADSITQNIFVQARPYPEYPLQQVSGITVSVNQPGFVFCQGSTITLYGEPGMASYTWSTGDTTQNISFTPVSAFNISLTCVDSAEYTWTSCYPAIAAPVPATIPPVLSILSNDTIFCMDDLGSSSEHSCGTTNDCYLSGETAPQSGYE